MFFPGKGLLGYCPSCVCSECLGEVDTKKCGGSAASVPAWAGPSPGCFSSGGGIAPALADALAGSALLATSMPRWHFFAPPEETRHLPPQRDAYLFA